MVLYQPSQIDEANLAYYYTAQQTSHGIYYRLKQPKEGFPSGFYASERSSANQQPVSSSANSPPNIRLSIAVYVGDPLDYQKYRHTALCLRPDDGSPSMIIHIIGPNMGYELNTKDNYDPTTSLKFAKEVQVGRLTTPMTKAQLASIICQTDIDNTSREFNCQTWVGDALQKLVNFRYLTQQDCDNGINRMVDAIMEAKDESE